MSGKVKERERVNAQAAHDKKGGKGGAGGTGRTASPADSSKSDGRKGKGSKSKKGTAKGGESKGKDGKGKGGTKKGGGRGRGAALNLADVATESREWTVEKWQINEAGQQNDNDWWEGKDWQSDNGE